VKKTATPGRRRGVAVRLAIGLREEGETVAHMRGFAPLWVTLGPREEERAVRVFGASGRRRETPNLDSRVPRRSADPARRHPGRRRGCRRLVTNASGRR
jgi:hypothetical protein